MRQDTGAIDGDLLYGVPAIAVFLNVRPRQAYHLIERARLPAFRLAGKVCARRSTLSAWLAECEQQAAPAPASDEGGPDPEN